MTVDKYEKEDQGHPQFQLLSAIYGFKPISFF